MIVFLILLIAVFVILAATLIILIMVRLVDLNKKFKLSNFRRQEQGVNDLIRYHTIIDDGRIIINKDGSIMAGWYLEGADHYNITVAQHEHLIAMINQLLNSLGGQTVLHHDVQRIESPKYIMREASHFPEEISEAIDESQRRSFEAAETMYESIQVLIMTFNPDEIAFQKLSKYMYDSEQEFTTTDYGKNIIANFKRQIEIVEATLSVYFRLTRLGNIYTEDEFGTKLVYNEFLQCLQYCITGIKQPILLPQDVTIPLDCVLGGQDLYTGTIPMIGRKYIITVSVDGYPQGSWPGIINLVTELPIQVRISNRMILLERYQAHSLAKNRERKWSQKQKGIKDVILNNPNPRYDLDAVNMTIDAQEAIAEINSGAVNYLHNTFTIVLMDENLEKIQQAASDVQKVLLNLGFSCRIEDVNNLEAFIGSWPGYAYENVRDQFIDSLVTAQLLPTSTINAGALEAPCPFYPPHSPSLMHAIASGNTTYRFNWHTFDVGHGLILGPTGKGKSTFIAYTAVQALRYYPVKIFAFDKGNSLYTLCKACGGSHMNIGDTSSPRTLAPFQYCNTDLERAWLLNWVDKLLLLNNHRTTPDDRDLVSKAIKMVYENTQNKEAYSSYIPSFNAFLRELQDNKMKSALAAYSQTGLMAGLLSGNTDAIEYSHFTVFEVEHLLGLGPNWSIPVLMHLFNRIEHELDGTPAFLYIDEAWAAFSNEVFCQYIFKWIKELRKKNCAVILSTQSLSDLEQSGLLDNLIENTASKVFLPNPGAMANDTSRRLYERFGLNSRQIDIIATAAEKREYYHFTAKGGRLIDLGLTPLALAFVAVSDPATIAQVKAFEAEYGDDWPEMYLRSKGIELSDFVDLAKYREIL